MKRVVLMLGAVLLLAGVVALFVPVSASDGDGHSVGCGSAAAADLSAARAQNEKGVIANVPILNEIVPHTDYVGLCQSALSSRRTWSIPLTVVGAIVVVAGVFVLRGRTGSQLSGGR